MATALTTPPLRQSIFEQMSCEHGYKLVHIDGLRSPESPESARGTDSHAVIAEYTKHCVKRQVQADFSYLDSLLHSASPEVAEIMDTCRDNLKIDFQNHFAAEVSWGLDKNWHPTYSYDHENNLVPIDPVWGIDDSGNEPEECGISDQILLMPGERVGEVTDYKTHPRAFPAETFQSKLYSVSAFCHLPTLQEVTFRLRFVRYANVQTSHTYYRQELPELIQDIKRVRQHQQDIHTKAAKGQQLRVHAGPACVYCPAAANLSCPILKVNPMLQLTPEQRLNFRLVYDVANRLNNKAMKDYVAATGEAIQGTDANGKTYTFGPVEKNKTTYPLFAMEGGALTMPIADALVDWAVEAPEDLHPKKGTPWFLNLRIGSTELNSYLKAKKRELIHNRCKDLAKTETKMEMRITRDAEVDDGTGEEHREFGEGGE